MHKCEHYTDSIYYLLEQTAKYCRYLGIQMFQKLNINITMDEFVALDVIQVNDGICQRELAKLILKDRPTTGRILNSLEEMGYVKRFVDTKNNRLVRRVSLTEKGKVITKEITDIVKQYMESLPKVFSDEDKENLIESLKQFRQSLEKEVEMNI